MATEPFRNGFGLRYCCSEKHCQEKLDGRKHDYVEKKKGPLSSLSLSPGAHFESKGGEESAQ